MEVGSKEVVHRRRLVEVGSEGVVLRRRVVEVGSEEVVLRRRAVEVGMVVRLHGGDGRCGGGGCDRMGPFLENKVKLKFLGRQRPNREVT
ncbi:hypothetical protein L2E82_34673 [Cichorium intybus]|uniref:Uncharacterized protein n=1 Tax=Cichorium intybus TaxID=13427 RepID=A0ACB9BMG7_CICIN|nr:hypothetical protein L2E82_34673 [Cichorium intybus]